ncbi:MAG: 3'(2'),5'-bisphosphate nucleotidase CysQ [Pseudomonadota bacterium]
MKILLLIAIKAAIEAGQEILDVYQRDFEVEIKEDKSPLTIADKNSHLLICKSLEATEVDGKKIPILSEEGQSISFKERKAWPYLWIVDPLDGTKEFIKRNGEFTVNIALVKGNKPILGVIFVPVTNVLYFGMLAFGSFKIDLNDFSFKDFDSLINNATKLPLKYEKEKYTAVASLSHYSKEVEAFINMLKEDHGEIELIRAGSSLKFCLVAEGQADIYPRFGPTMEWDTAAGQVICHEAGKFVVDSSTGKEMLYNREDLINKDFIIK